MPLIYAGPKRMRAPQQQQQPEASSAFASPFSEIAMQQQMLRERHSGGSSPSMVPSSPFGGSAHQDSDADQLHMGPTTTGRLHSCSPGPQDVKHTELAASYHLSHHSPFTIHRSPFTIHRSPFTTHCSPLTFQPSPLTAHHSPLMTPAN